MSNSTLGAAILVVLIGGMAASVVAQQRRHLDSHWLYIGSLLQAAAKQQ